MVVSTNSKIFFLLILMFFLVGCGTQSPTGQVVKQITCNKPYILVGDDCCLDKDDNSICDKDETTQEETEEPKTLTIEDLQTDMGDVIGQVIALTKDSELDYAQVYSNKVRSTHFLGKYGIIQYSKLITKKPQKVVQITDSKHYLKDKKDFQNFVIENKDLFIETALESKELFEDEFKGQLPKNIHLRKNPIYSDAEKAKYVSHSELSSVVYYDDVTFPETISQNLAEINYIRVNKYEITITHPWEGEIKEYTEELSNINYGQSIVILCNPILVIGLSFEDYGDGKYVIYERNFDRFYVDSDYFLTPIRNHYQQLINDSQALVKMCEQKY